MAVKSHPVPRNEVYFTGHIHNSLLYWDYKGYAWNNTGDSALFLRSTDKNLTFAVDKTLYRIPK